MRLPRWKSNLPAFSDCPHLALELYSYLASHYIDVFFLFGMDVFHSEIDTPALVFEAGVLGVE
jgi:hypothetical protein